MKDTGTYSVVLKGSIKPGFQPKQVIMAFASLCKIPPQKAANIIGKPFVLKRGLDTQLARQYAIKLSRIGVDVVLKRDAVGAGETAGNAVAETQPISAKLLIAPIIVAVFGSLLWYLIAVELNFELGLTAWLIGGGIGYAALFSGAKSHRIGAICVVLTLVSVLSGKYLAAVSYESELADFLSSTSSKQTSDFRSIYEGELQDAYAFSRIPKDDDNLRHYMAARGYSQHVEASGVTDAELASFRAETAPRLHHIESQKLSFHEWREYTLGEAITNTSALALMIGSFGKFDLLFILFGIASAYLFARTGNIDPRPFVREQLVRLRAVLRRRFATGN